MPPSKKKKAAPRFPWGFGAQGFRGQVPEACVVPTYLGSRWETQIWSIRVLGGHGLLKA